MLYGIFDALIESQLPITTSIYNMIKEYIDPSSYAAERQALYNSRDFVLGRVIGDYISLSLAVGKIAAGASEIVGPIAAGGGISILSAVR
ncbi:MAG: hypothetical protein LBL96_07850 [Clostridiales bacterium]|nr:hypothetical protein [Clostridiales bacterium]